MSSEPLHEQAQHPLLPTTTSRPEPAPGSLLTKSDAKRSWAALEPEFVDSNDINGIAPSSAILRADQLVIDDDQILAEKIDRSEDLTAITSAGTPASQPFQPSPKRFKTNNLDQPQPSATDLAALGDEDAVIQPALSFTHLKTVPPLAPTSSSPHTPLEAPPPPPLPEQEENLSSARRRSHSISRGRAVAQLAPSPNQNQPFIGEERLIARTIGDPIDTTRATVPMSIYLDPGPPPVSMMPLVSGRKPSLRPGKDTSIEKLDAWHNDVTMTGPFGTKVTATATATATSPHDTDVVMADTLLSTPTTTTTSSSSPPLPTIPGSTGTTTDTNTAPFSSSSSSSSSSAPERPVALNKTRRPSASFIMSTTHPFGQPKKSAQPKHVRIQILDDAETAKIREATEQAQRDQDLSIQHEIEQDDERRAEQELLLLEAGQNHKKKKHKTTPEANQDLADSPGQNDDDIVLPIEDPVTHDWDREELEEDDNGGGDGDARGGRNPSGRRGNKAEDTQRRVPSSRSQKAKAAIGAGSTSSVPKATGSTEDGDVPTARNDEEDDDDDDEDTDDDPEQQLPAMSEMQEEETHNSHVRLETQADFQLTAGLDRGELDADAYDEEGRYIGCIEQDDEGASEYENR